MEEMSIDLGAFMLSGIVYNKNATGLTLLGLHGWLDNAATFKQLAAQLPNHKIIALDFLGHGHSDHLPAGVPYHFIDNVTHTVKVINQLELEHVILLGHSMGAVIASLLAAIDKKRIKAWVSIDCFGPLVNTVSDAPSALKNAIDQFILAERKQSPVYPNLEKALTAREQVSNDPSGLLIDIVERGMQKKTAGYIWRTDPRLRVASALRFTEPHAQTLMSEIEAPGLFVEAINGIEHAKTYFQSRQKYCKNIIHVKIPGGHHAHIQHPKECAEAIEHFLQTIV